MVMLKRAGADLTFRVMPGAGHDVSWWPTEGPLIDAFEEEHPREGRVTKSAETLLRYAAGDDDRAMLFGADLKILVP